MVIKEGFGQQLVPTCNSVQPPQPLPRREPHMKSCTSNTGQWIKANGTTEHLNNHGSISIIGVFVAWSNRRNQVMQTLKPVGQFKGAN
jgi:hypothetical protein